MNELKLFENSAFGSVRTIEEGGKILFCGSDVAKSLGYDQPHKAIERHCKKDGGTFHTVIDSLGREQLAKFITEGDLYRLIANSKLPSAEQFESWVFDEVLPSIRKHGMYAKEELLENPDLLIKVATQLKIEREQRLLLEKSVEQNRPKVLFAESVQASSNSVLVGELAKVLNQNGVKIGQNRLFDYLRDNDYLCKRGESKNLPTQRAMDMGLFELKKRTINNPDGSIRTTTTTKVTGKGQIYFVNKFLGSEN